MSTYTVSTTAALASTLATAQGGDTVLLAPGEYDNVVIKNLSFASAVTVASQDPTHPAVLTSLLVTGDKYLNLSHLEFDLSAAQMGAATPFRVANSSRVTLSYLDVHGSMDGNPQDDAIAMAVNNSNYVTVSNSEFQQAAVAITHLGDTHLTITGNSFHDLRYDGVHGSGSNWVTVSNNTFTSFYPVGTQPTGGDHPDAIQFFTLGTTVATHDLVVTGNTIVRGAGAPTHGVFFDDEVGTLPFQNVTIKNNTVIGEGCDGISVNHAANVTIAGNTVQAYVDLNPSRIQLINVAGASVTNNSAAKYAYDPTVTGLTTANDKVIAAVATPDALLSASSALLPDGMHSLVLTGFQNLTGAANGAADHITGNLGNDTLVAGTGNDTFTGGGGSNVFVFGPVIGKDVITNFGANWVHDTMDISALLKAGATPLVQDATAGLVITFSNTTGSIQLLGVHPSQLHTIAGGFSVW
jgi:parallel beta-helix repeat protein